MNALAPYLPQWYSLWIIWTLLALDVATTYYAITKRGAYEANPVMAWLMKVGGLLPALVITHAAVGWYVWRYFGEIGIPALWVMSAFFALVVGNNLRLILIARNA